MHPDRVPKKPGKIAIDRLTLRNHALTGGSTRDELVTIFSGKSLAAAKTTLRRIGCRAFGRNLSQAELKVLLGIYSQTLEQTQSQTEATRDALMRLLVSPPLLLRYNERPETGSTSVMPEGTRKIASGGPAF